MLLLCLLALPASAWECTFENYPGDIYIEEPNIFSGDFNFENTNGNSYYHAFTNTYGVDKNFHVEKGFENSLFFSINANGLNNYLTVKFYDANGTLLASRTTDYEANSGNQRVSILRSGASNNYDMYYDGKYYTISTPVGSEIASFSISMRIYTAGTNLHIYIDDLKADEADGDMILGFDSPAKTLENKDISYGIDCADDYVYNLSLYNSTGSIISTQSISADSGKRTFTMPSTAGNYKVRLTGYDSTANPKVNYFLYTKDLVVEGLDTYNSVVEFDKDLYSKGEMARISTHFSPYSSGYRMMFVYGDKYIENQITQEDQSFPMVIPLNIDTNYVFAYIVDSSGDVLAYDQAEIEGMTPDPVLKLDKSSYSPSDSIQVQYWYIPVGTKLTATYYLNGVKKQSSTITINSVSGTEHFTIGGRDADSVTISAHSDTKVYASVSADIYFGNYYVSGKVFDMITGATVSDAIVSTTAFSVTTDENGAYNHSVSPGQIYVTIAADGYEDLHTSMYLISPSTVKNFYIIPEYTSGDSSVFGAVVDFYNGAGIQGALVKIQQNGTTYTAMTSKKGYFLIDVPGMSGSWKMTVSKTGYESYSKTITLSGDTYEDVSLVPVGGATADPDSSGDSGSPGSSDSTDRPSREAAKDSLTWLETTMPNLIKLAVVVFMLALIGWRF